MLDDLYKHHVRTARIQILLISIDEALGNVCAAAADSLHAYLAKGLLQAVAIAMQRVLLDGGPNRCALKCVTDLTLGPLEYLLSAVDGRPTLCWPELQGCCR